MEEDITTGSHADGIEVAGGISTGLGISVNAPASITTPRQVTIQPAPRRAKSQAASLHHAAASPDSLISPLSATIASSSVIRSDGLSPDFTPYTDQQEPLRSLPSVRSSAAQSFASDAEMLPQEQLSPSILSRHTAYSALDAETACKAKSSVYRGRAHWISTGLLICSVYSTIFSGIFLVLALKAPRYGTMIRTNGSLDSATASLLTAVIAKTIELTFVTAIVSFVGQVLSRRAYENKKGDAGVTLAEFTMRSWIVQPGQMITHWESVKYAALSVLGFLSIFSAICTMLYTTASQALVQPLLKFGPEEPMVMQGLVKTSYANTYYTTHNCQTPISTEVDQSFAGSTCLAMEHAGLSYHNFLSYTADWATISTSQNGSSDLALRPKGFGLFNENTTVTSPWIEISDAVLAHRKYGRVINNVTLALPHVGVVQAASDAINGIMQPQDLDGQGVYQIRASVPSPVVNVLCTAMTAEELTPLVFDLWDRDNMTALDTATWPAQIASTIQNTYLNATVVDHIFGWDLNTSDSRPPIFPKLPNDYNTVLYTPKAYGSESIYILAKNNEIYDSNYMLCGLRSFLTPSCSTQYNASGSGATLEAICEDPADDMAYIRSKAETTTVSDVGKDWVSIAATWADAISLSPGITDGNASTARLLSQLIPTQPVLDTFLPSIAEALAEMAACTALLSVQDSPFVMYWDHPAVPYHGLNTTVLPQGIYQSFNATIKAQQYASGGTASYQLGFHIILFGVFLLNLLVLAHLGRHRNMVTDFSELPTLFSLAVNSPPSSHLARSSGGGPEGEYYKVPWRVNSNDGHLFVESQESPQRTAKKTFTQRFEMVDSPLAKAYTRLSSPRWNH